MKPNIRTLARKAFKKRYGYKRVCIGHDGQIWAHYDPSDGIGALSVGNVKDCYTTKVDDGSIRFSHLGQLVYVFNRPTEQPND